MRVISSDYTINASYENSLFCVIEDEANNEYYIGIRNSSLTSYLPIATYSTKEAAVNAMKQLVDYGNSSLNSNTKYVISSEK